MPKRYVRISLEDCYMLQLLLQKGMSFKDCLDILASSKTYSVFTDLKVKITKGEPIQEALNQILDKKIVSSFSFFCQFLSLEKSLKCSLSLASLNLTARKEIFKKLFYPSIMLLLVIIFSLLFNFFFLPIMINLLKSFQSDIQTFMFIAAILKGFSIFLIFITLIISIIVLFSIQQSNITSVYEFLISHFHVSFLKRLFSYWYIRYFLELIRVGCSTQQSIQMMRKTEGQPLINMFSLKIDELLLMGKSIYEAFSINGFDPLLSKFVAVGTYSSNMEKLLENYCELTKRGLEKKLKQLTSFIQGLTYCFIAIILIFIYQILLSPMNVITQI